MHDDREAAGKSDPGLLQAAAHGDLHGPRLECEGFPASRQEQVGRFLQQLAQSPVTLFGGPARSVEFDQVECVHAAQASWR